MVSRGLLALLTAGAVLLVACGDEGADDRAARTPRPIGQAGPAPVSAVVEVWLGDFAIMPWRPHLQEPGAYTLIVSNRGSEPHDLVVVRWPNALDAMPQQAGRALVANLEVVARTEVIEAGLEVDLVLELDAGRYALVSSQPRDFGAGMAATLTVGEVDAATTVVPATIDDDRTVGVYLADFAIFRSREFSLFEDVTLAVQNVGRRPHDLAVVQWRGEPDALPVRDGRLLLDGLIVLGQLDALAPGAAATLEVTLVKGVTYALVSTLPGEYEAGLAATFEVR